MLADSFLDKRGGLIPIQHLCGALGELCIPLAGRRILDLRLGGAEVESQNFDELMIELELCIGLIFKPLRHHLKNVVNEDRVILLSMWKPALEVLKEILKDPNNDDNGAEGENGEVPSARVLKATNELTIEHLKNVIMVLISFGVLQPEPQMADDISAITWDAVGQMDFCKGYLDEWKQAAIQQT
jgi:hypothetical protein